ncbi:proteasome lid subunit RPN8/RPN11 [Melghirimyces profundicolus]|uniref:Proteasome lid subunit RPN8/RPN11 n=2 Tax=Melghirimyces profundicolus TaxID=1242148 RepID=A0A2T6BWA9_9BACL|nr:proteasome lid subunit RPN8/RPN11 [Melghirimyces profundicolus]
MVFRIRESTYKAMIKHCLGQRPYEACGLLSGKNGQTDTLWEMKNILCSPTSFAMDEVQLRQTFKKMEKSGGRLTGIYHSHPTGPPRPSSTDIANATYPEAVYLIVSLAQTTPSVGCYRILGKSQVIPLSLNILSG